MSVDTKGLNAGVLASVEYVAEWICSTGRRYLTVSGGEPMEQAPALIALIDLIRAEREWIVTCYSGYRFEALQQDHRPCSSALLERLDLLIDGPYLPDRHASLLWRGSTNQRMHSLSGRVQLPEDTSAGLSVHYHDDGSFELIGVPPEPEMVARLSGSLAASGTPVTVSAKQCSFPFPTHEVY